MGKEREALEFVYSQVADEVGKMYARYKKKCNLEHETNIERQLEILINKKYISKSYQVDLMVLADYYLREMYARYTAGMHTYKERIMFLLDSME